MISVIGGIITVVAIFVAFLVGFQLAEARWQRAATDRLPLRSNRKFFQVEELTHDDAEAAAKREHIFRVMRPDDRRPK